MEFPSGSKVPPGDVLEPLVARRLSFLSSDRFSLRLEDPVFSFYPGAHRHGASLDIPNSKGEKSILGRGWHPALPVAQEEQGTIAAFHSQMLCPCCFHLVSGRQIPSKAMSSLRPGKRSVFLYYIFFTTIDQCVAPLSSDAGVGSQWLPII
jgi:hypothetical protein